MLPVRRAIQLQRTMRLEMLQQMSCATSQEGYWASYSAQKQENKIV